MLLTACSNSKSSNKKSTPNATDSLDDSLSPSLLPTVTINTDNLQTITNSNASDFSVDGTCLENNREVRVSIGDISPSPQPTCSNGKWSVKVDVTRLGDSTVTITANHSNSEGEEAEQASELVTNSFICPTGFIAVPPLTGYTTLSFLSGQV